VAPRALNGGENSQITNGATARAREEEEERKKERKKERKEEERERRVGALFCVEVMPYPSMLRSHARKDGVTP
jgi:ribosomal protein L12E/L44/L45/RPP1/RPP2